MAMLLLASAVATGPAAPVRVHVASPTELALSDWLIGRLLEEGFTVTGPDDAAIALSIARADDEWAVDVQGETHERFVVPVDDDNGVARLELLHVAVGALDAVQPRAAAPELPSFAIAVAPIFAPEARAALATELARAVLEAGGAVAPDRASASLVICAALGEAAVDVDVRAADEECPAADATVPMAVRERAREVVVAALSASSAPIDSEPASDDEHAPLGRREPAVPERDRPWTDAAFVVRGGASLGIVGRVRTPDAVVAASLFIGREPGVAAWLDVQIIPEPRRGPLLVLEVIPAVGARVRAFQRGRIALDIGALLGLQLHGYRFAADVLRSSGIAGDWSIEGAAALAIRLWRAHELSLMLRAGRSGRDREHTVEHVTVWHREAWRIGATVGLTFGRRLRQ